MPKKYTIRAGFTFRGDDGHLATGGDTIELEDDVAKLHAHKLEPAEEAPKRSKKQAASTPPAGAGSAPNADPAGAGEGAADPAGDGDGDGAGAGSSDPAGTDPAADPQ